MSDEKKKRSAPKSAAVKTGEILRSARAKLQRLRDTELKAEREYREAKTEADAQQVEVEGLAKAFAALGGVMVEGGVAQPADLPVGR